MMMMALERPLSGMLERVDGRMACVIIRWRREVFPAGEG